MQVYKGVFNSDRVNLQGIRFSLCALESALSQRWSTGTPDCLGHDRTCVVGWGRPLGVHIQPHLARLTGLSFLGQTPDEFRQLVTQAGSYYRSWISEHVLPHFPTLLSRLGDVDQNLASACYADCAAVVMRNVAVRTAPDIFTLRDKDGLVPLAALNPVDPGVFLYADDLLLFADRFFRRSLSRMNTLNTSFLGRLEAVDRSLNPRIKLDEDMVGLASTFQRSVELQYWYGPKFDDNIQEMPNGITVHKADDAARLYHGIDRTEFWWYGEGDQRSFEAEEIIQRPSVAVSVDSYGCRFVHSMFSADTSEPVHLDGAIRLYDDEKMLARWDQNIYEAGRKSSYTKLWRVDGAFPVSDWKSLITDYFRDNWLVGEYFGAKKPNFRPEVIPQDVNPIQSLIPYNMGVQDGVQLHVSYHERTVSTAADRIIRAFDCLTRDDGEELYFIDSTATEVLKRLREQGLSIELPLELAMVSFGDTVLNLPLIHHSGDAAVKNAEGTLATISRLIGDLVGRDPDRLVSICLAIDYVDREIRFSWAGHATALAKWFSGQGTSLPSTVEACAEWMQDNYDKLNEEFTNQPREELLHLLLQDSGMLVFIRRFLDPGLYELKMDEQSGQLTIKWLFEESNVGEAALIRQGQVQPAAAYRILKSECTLCGENYESCPHIKFQAEGVGRRIVDSELLVVFLTNRKA